MTCSKVMVPASNLAVARRAKEQEEEEEEAGEKERKEKEEREGVWGTLERGAAESRSTRNGVDNNGAI